MSHDISRDSDLLNRSKGYVRVRRLQGRMFTDADFNEQVDILERAQREFLVDLIGAHAGPNHDSGFAIHLEGDDLPADKKKLQGFHYGAGTYYADGRRVRTSEAGSVVLPRAIDAWRNSDALLVYLDVWSVPVTPLEDRDLLDPGFAGRDSADRELRVWRLGAALLQVTESPKDGGTPPPPPAATTADVTKIDTVAGLRFLRGDPDEPQPGPRVGDAFAELAFVVGPPEGLDPDDHCVILPDPERYAGPEAQLYRLEVHRGGPVPSDITKLADARPRVKWSRDNAAPAFAIEKVEEPSDADAGPMTDGPTWRVTLTSLEALGGLRTLEPQSWVELLGPEWYLRKARLPLLWVARVEPDSRTATLGLGPRLDDVTEDEVEEAIEALRAAFDDPAAVGKTRLVAWDHLDGDFRGLKLERLSGLSPSDYPGVRLERGIAALIRNRDSDGKLPEPSLLAGDFWLFPARPGQPSPTTPKERPDFGPPSGPDHAYAPLAALLSDGTTIQDPIDLRKTFAARINS